jgi:hypothetical protein
MHDTHLRLSIISKEEAQFFGEVLRMHKQLQDLMLHFEFINQADMDNFAEYLKQTSITYFFLSRSVITAANCCNIFYALRHMKALKKLHITVELLPKEEKSFAEILLNEGFEQIEFGRECTDDDGFCIKRHHVAENRRVIIKTSIAQIF